MSKESRDRDIDMQKHHTEAWAHWGLKEQERTGIPAHLCIAMKRVSWDQWPPEAEVSDE